jgi:hypothetical protein
MESDLKMLEQLNRDYIDSVQRMDVQRFDAILAEDFLASNPDGSLVDKKAFLAQTAKPVTISGLIAQDVKIRILVMSRSSTRRRATRPPTARINPAATPTFGHGAMASGSRWRRT